MIMSFLTDLRFALRSLARVKGLAITVIVTLALGIGANAAIFSVVRGVLLRPLVNRDEDRLIYIRQSAHGHRRRERHLLGAGDPGPAGARQDAERVRRLLDRSSFTMVGLGEPRVVRAGVVGGSYFDVMGLRPVLGRLLDATRRRAEGRGRGGADPSLLDDGAGQRSDRSSARPSGSATRSATIVGVLEPSVPYPSETEIIANVVTSPHHLSATMVTGRVHRMTELFGRLAPGADLEAARAELRAVHGAMVKEHPEAYPPKADFRIDAVRLRDQITSPARTVLLVLLAASALVFVIACSNVANLILARSVRREGELAIRAALGASAGALRRTLLAESLLLCGAGAILGVLIARPMVAVLARYAARFSVRALDLTVDASLLWVGVGLALAAAVLLAFVPRLPSPNASNGFGLSNGSVRITSGTNRRLRLFAVTQIAASFVLLAGAGMLLTTLLALQAARDRLRHAQRARASTCRSCPTGARRSRSSASTRKRCGASRSCPASSASPSGTVVPWRDAGAFGPGFQFSVEGYAKANGEEDPRAQFRTVSPGFFAALGVPIIAGRDFTDADRRDAREGRHRQPEPGAADVPEPGRGQPPPDVDRSGHEVHRRQHRRRAASSASPPTSTTRTSCRGRR